MLMLFDAGETHFMCKSLFYSVRGVLAVYFGERKKERGHIQLSILVHIISIGPVEQL